MKKLQITFVFLFMALSAFATDNAKYISAMESAIEASKTAKSIEDMQQVANRFERISAAEKEEWYPAYWAAYTYATMAYATKEDKHRDGYTDKAEKLLNVAKERNADKVEYLVLKGMIAQARLAASPMTRWMTEGKTLDNAVADAKKLDPNNPRIYYLEGSGLFYKPAMFGGGKKAAKPILEEALKKYDAYQPASHIAPNWGREFTEKLVKQCQEG
jgi:hypothetical protein